MMADTPIVSLECGKIMGKMADEIYLFEGIPYASVKERFLPPEDVKPWGGIRQCSYPGPKCPQPSAFSGQTDSRSHEFCAGEEQKYRRVFRQMQIQTTGLDLEILLQPEKEDENCLCLNILTPAVDLKKRPVLVYIHGGGYTTGSGNAALAAREFVRIQDTVLVSVNERLGAFGYLYLGKYSQKYEDSGNLGLLDICWALSWVRKNIALFGGDPENVTLIGESGGAAKICALLSMKDAEYLFHKAICISGAMPAGTLSCQEAADNTAYILRKLGIEEDSWEEILHVPARELADLSTDAELARRNPLIFLPVGDDKHIHYNPDFIYPSGGWSAAVPIIAGSSEDECGFLFSEEKMSKEEGINRLTAGVKTCFGRTEAMSASIAHKLYETAQAECIKQEEPWHVFIKILSQISVLGAGAYRLAETRTRQGDAPCFLYDMALDSKLDPLTGSACAWHVADLMDFFYKKTEPEHLKIANALSDMVGCFLRTGSPFEDKYGWEAYSLDERRMMVFDSDIRFEEDPMPKTRELCSRLNIRQLV